MEHQLYAESLTVGYDDKVVIEDLSVSVPNHKISVIIGANGCGKSTLLKTFSRLLKPQRGKVLLDGKMIQDYHTKELAKTLGLLPQSPLVPEGITVIDLVSRGRYPYQKALKGMSKADYAAVEEALEIMGIKDLAERCVDELSGGQRQRVWIAMALAQDTDVLLLDEPTTYLDITYQVEILDLLVELNEKKGTTIVMILHDINLSARYADHLIAMNKGKIIAEGTPDEIVTKEIMKKIYHLNCVVYEDKLSGAPYIVPIGRRR